MLPNYQNLCPSEWLHAETVVRWHQFREVDIEYTLHNFIVLAICVPKIIKFGADLTKFWQKQVGSFLLAHPVLKLNKKIFKNTTGNF